MLSVVVDFVSFDIINSNIDLSVVLSDSLGVSGDIVSEVESEEGITATGFLDVSDVGITVSVSDSVGIALVVVSIEGSGVDVGVSVSVGSSVS